MSKLTKDFAYQLAYRIITVITPLITSPYLSRTLGADKLGVFSATYAYANYYILSAILGVEFYGNRSIAVVANNIDERKRIFWNIYTVQFIAAVISIMIYYSTYRIRFDESRYVICCLQGLWVIASGLDINWYFFGKQEFKVTVTRNIIIKVLSILCIFVFVHSPEDLPKYVFIMSFSMVISQACMWLFLLRDIGFSKPQIEEVKQSIKPILVLFIPVIAMSIYHIMDKSMVDNLSDETNGGYYYVVDRIVNIPLGIITGLGTVMLPRISKLVREDASKTNIMLHKSSELSMFLIAAIAFGLGSIAKTFVPLFFGKGYEPCIRMLELFVPTIIVKAMSDFIRQQFLIPAKKDRVYVCAVLCGAAVDVIINLLLIKKYGATGAVLGSLVAEVTVLIIEILGCANDIDFLELFISHRSYIYFGLAMMAVVKLLEATVSFQGIYKLVLLIGSGACFYIVCCIIYWIKAKDSIFKPYIKKVISILT